MKRTLTILAALGLLAAAALTITAGSTAAPNGTKFADATPWTCDKKSVRTHVKLARGKLNRAYAGRRWRDRTPMKPRERRVVKWRLRCVTYPKADRTIKRYWHKKAVQFRKKRSWRRHVALYLPYNCGGGIRSAISCSIMFCESGGNYRARNPSSTAGGKYQIIDSTWYGYGGSSYADSHPAAVAPPREQDRIATAIWAGGSGRSQWAC